MAYRNLMDFIETLEKAGELRRVAAEVDPRLEITEITDRVSKAGGPALLFENVKGSEFPVLMNAFGSERRVITSYSIHYTKLYEEYRELFSYEELPDRLS